MIGKLTKLTAVLVLAFILCVPAASAAAPAFIPYEGYDYNSFGESVPAPVGYIPAALVTGQDLKTGDLDNPQDFCFAGDRLYLLDSGNGRIIVTDEDFHVRREIASFQTDGEEITFTGARGLFVDTDGTILVADTENQRIIVADTGGKVRQLLYKPESELISESRQFEVHKVMRDPNGIIYALVAGVNEGAVTYKPDGSFGGFFASNDVEKTAQVILDFLWSRFMTDAQIRKSRSRTPSEFTNFDIDPLGFVYTVTATLGAKGNVRKLNFKGSNILETQGLGDYEWDRKLKQSVTTRMTDIDVDDEGFLTMIDAGRGRIFQYTDEGGLITAFGGLGDQLGTFKSPVAVETHGGRVYVLDNMMNAVTVFEPTGYAKAFRSAYGRFKKGDYAGSMEHWNTVLRHNSNSEWAYYGIGRALAEDEQYAESLRYFRLSYANGRYSDSFAEVRKDFIRGHFALLLLGALALIAAAVLAVRAVRKRFARQNLYTRSILETKYTYPLYTAIHPLDGFEALKQSKGWSLKAAGAILVSLFLTLCMQWFLTGFSFNAARASDFNVLITLTQAFGVIGVWVVSNWAVCTLIDGKGRLKEIFCMSAYALAPFLVFTLLGILLSNVLILEEGAFLVFCGQAGVWWSAVALLAGLSRIHQFSFRKTLLSVLLTIVGIAIIIFLAIMFFGLMQQLISFFKSIYSEIQMMR